MVQFDEATIANANSIHDKLYRGFLKNKIEFSRFLSNFFNINIPSNNLIEVSSNFVTEKFENKTSDIIYNVKNEPLYFLLEHQSSIDRRMNIRILEYYTNLIKNIFTSSGTRNKNYIIPKIIPILIYTGGRPWKPPPNLSTEYFKIDYKFIDINTFSVNSLLSMNTAISFAMAIDKCKTEEECLEYINKLIKCNISNIDKKSLKMLFKYIALNFKSYDVTNILLKKLNEGSSDTMELVGMARACEDILRNREKERILGRTEGRREGEYFGIIKGKKYMIRKMLENGESIEKIKLYSNVSIRQINEVKEELKHKKI